MYGTSGFSDWFDMLLLSTPMTNRGVSMVFHYLPIVACRSSRISSYVTIFGSVKYRCCYSTASTSTLAKPYQDPQAWPLYSMAENSCNFVGFRVLKVLTIVPGIQFREVAGTV